MRSFSDFIANNLFSLNAGEEPHRGYELSVDQYHYLALQREMKTQNKSSNFADFLKENLTNLMGLQKSWAEKIDSAPKDFKTIISEAKKTLKPKADDVKPEEKENDKEDVDSDDEFEKFEQFRPKEGTEQDALIKEYLCLRAANGWLELAAKYANSPKEASETYDKLWYEIKKHYETKPAQKLFSYAKEIIFPGGNILKKRGIVTGKSDSAQFFRAWQKAQSLVRKHRRDIQRGRHEICQMSIDQLQQLVDAEHNKMQAFLPDDFVDHTDPKFVFRFVKGDRLKTKCINTYDKLAEILENNITAWKYDEKKPASDLMSEIIFYLTQNPKLLDCESPVMEYSARRSGTFSRVIVMSDQLTDEKKPLTNDDVPYDVIVLQKSGSQLKAVWKNNEKLMSKIFDSDAKQLLLRLFSKETTEFRDDDLVENIAALCGFQEKPTIDITTLNDAAKIVREYLDNNLWDVVKVANPLVRVDLYFWLRQRVAIIQSERNLHNQLLDRQKTLSEGINNLEIRNPELRSWYSALSPKDQEFYNQFVKTHGLTLEELDKISLHDDSLRSTRLKDLEPMPSNDPTQRSKMVPSFLAEMARRHAVANETNTTKLKLG